MSKMTGRQYRIYKSIYDGWEIAKNCPDDLVQESFEMKLQQAYDGELTTIKEMSILFHLWLRVENPDE